MWIASSFRMKVDTPAVQALRAHLLRLSRDSVPPSVGVTRALPRSPEEAAVLHRFAPFAELLFLVAAFSGGIDVKKERGVILGAFRALTGGRVHGERLEELERTIRERMEASQTEDLLEEVASDLALRHQEAELGFSLAAAVVLADRRIVPAEEAFLSTLAEWLNIPEARARQLLSGAADA